MLSNSSKVYESLNAISRINIFKYHSMKKAFQCNIFVTDYDTDAQRP